MHDQVFDCFGICQQLVLRIGHCAVISEVRTTEYELIAERHINSLCLDCARKLSRSSEDLNEGGLPRDLAVLPLVDLQRFDGGSRKGRCWQRGGGPIPRAPHAPSILGFLTVALSTALSARRCFACLFSWLVSS